MNILWVALGGAIGSVLRYLISTSALRWGSYLPWGTLTVNVAGCFFIGFFLPIGLIKVPVPMRLFLMTGVLGGLTTFSTFSFECWSFFLAGQWAQGLLNIVLNLGLSLLAAGLGYWTACRLI